MSRYSYGYQEVPDHVRRIIERDGDIEFTPPSFERWLGRLQMLRTLSAMGAFLLVFLASYTHGQSWDTSAIRGIVASIVFYFFGWAAGLFIFGELYDIEVRHARHELEIKEKERQRRIEEYYRERLREQEAEFAAEHGMPVPATAAAASALSVVPIDGAAPAQRAA